MNSLIRIYRLRLTRNGLRHAHRFKHTQTPTVVEKFVHDSIKATGPISFATYMKLCLSHPTHGYYMNPNNHVFGRKGDFITSPEISQAFGELIGIWLYSQYLGRSEPIRIIELGPGRGTLMDDILRVVSKFHKTGSIDVHLVETSQYMRSLQNEKLGSRPNITLHWHNSISELRPSSDKFTFLIAHEFFDALPVYVIRKTSENAWTDVLIASNIMGEDQSESPTTTESTSIPHPSSLRVVLTPEPSEASNLLGKSSPRFSQLPIGSQIEVSPDSYRIARKIGEILQSGRKDEGKSSPIGGCGLIVDYGGDMASEDSLRAFKQHKAVDLFYKPGECDITANVDFGYLEEAVRDIVTVLGPITQSSFLRGMKIEERTAALVASSDSELKKEQLRGATERLISPEGMGVQYWVLGMVSQDLVKDRFLPYPFHEKSNEELM